MRTQRHTQATPSEQVILSVTRSPYADSLPFTLSTRRTRNQKVSGEILLNSTMRVPVEEHRNWTPAQMVYVVTNHLVLPGDAIWFTEPMW